MCKLSDDFSDLSTHAELVSATARGRSYWETEELGQRIDIAI